MWYPDRPPEGGYRDHNCGMGRALVNLSQRGEWRPGQMLAQIKLEEEKIEPIILDRRADPADIPDADEGFDDLVYDEDAQTYKLIERDSEEQPDEPLMSPCTCKVSNWE